MRREPARIREWLVARIPFGLITILFLAGLLLAAEASCAADLAFGVVGVVGTSTDWPRKIYPSAPEMQTVNSKTPVE